MKFNCNGNKNFFRLYVTEKDKKSAVNERRFHRNYDSYFNEYRIKQNENKCVLKKKRDVK